MPALRQVRELTESGVPRIHAAEAYDPSVGWVVSSAAQELPTPVIGVMRYAKDRSTGLKDLASGDRGGVWPIRKWPVIHELPSPRRASA
jgi:hypothetical protein